MYLSALAGHELCQHGLGVAAVGGNRPKHRAEAAVPDRWREHVDAAVARGHGRPPRRKLRVVRHLPDVGKPSDVGPGHVWAASGGGRWLADWWNTTLTERTGSPQYGRLEDLATSRSKDLDKAVFPQ